MNWSTTSIMKQVSTVTSQIYIMAAPFGSKTERFIYLGLHPKLDNEGCLKRNRNLGPATYHVKSVYRHIPNLNWTRESEIEKFSRNLGYHVPEKLKERKEELTAAGPGNCDVPTFLEIKNRCRHNVKKNIGFTLGKRFVPSRHALMMPPPGMYIKKHSSLVKHQWTPVCPFEWDSFAPRQFFKSSPWSLAPNHYCYVDPKSVSETWKHYVTERGPYDTFTGPRDETTIKNHFTPSSLKLSATWPLSLPCEMDRLKKYPHIGRWHKGSRDANPGIRLMLESLSLCLRDPNGPSPAEYDPVLPSEIIPKESKYPFDSSVRFSRPVLKYKIQPGPGRYNVKIRKNENGCQSSFKVKVNRCDFMIPEPYNNF